MRYIAATEFYIFKKMTRFFLTAALLAIAVGSSFGCHHTRGRHRRAAGDEKNNTETVKETEYMRNFMTHCLESKLGVTKEIESWQSVLDFSVLDSKWFEDYDQNACAIGFNDTRACWKEAVRSYLNISSYMFEPTMQCIDAYQERLVTDHNCTTRGWTPFFSSGVPIPGGLGGDRELLEYHRQDFPNQICASPNAIRVKTVARDIDYKSTGERVAISPGYGFNCENAIQPDGACNDYKVGYCCPYDALSQCAEEDWSTYYSRDMPWGASDIEWIYKSMTCHNPTAIEARVVSTKQDYRDAGQNVTIDLIYGFQCHDRDQHDGRKCLNYEIRVCCPKVRDFTSEWYAGSAKNRARREVSAGPYVTYSNCFTREVTLPPVRTKLQMETVVELVKVHVVYGKQNETWQKRLHDMVREDSPVSVAVTICNKEVYNITSTPSSGWSQWSSWDNCPSRCGEYGEQLRRRQCINGSPGIAPCLGSLHDKRQCQPPLCWSTWTPCTETCGPNAVRTRLLECSNHDASNLACTNPTKQEERCNLGPCEGWSEWTSWSQCHSQCGQEVDQRRTRFCTTGAPGSAKCPGPDYETQPCEVLNPICGDWGQWAACSTTCGDGKRTRTRECGNSQCYAPTSQEETCPQQEPCPTSSTNETEGGLWSNWQPWDHCSAQCGQTAKQYRRRHCTTGGHPPCIGDQLQVQDCTKNCGNWGQWTEFEDCIGRCGTSTKSRTRECIGGKPGEEACWGNAKETHQCWTGTPC